MAGSPVRASGVRKNSIRAVSRTASLLWMAATVEENVFCGVVQTTVEPICRLRSLAADSATDSWGASVWSPAVHHLPATTWVNAGLTGAGETVTVRAYRRPTPF